MGASIAGQDVDTTLTVAELNHNGIYNDAPDVVTDVNHDGQVDAKDLKAIGVASNIVTVAFHINGQPPDRSVGQRSRRFVAATAAAGRE